MTQYSSSSSSSLAITLPLMRYLCLLPILLSLLLLHVSHAEARITSTTSTTATTTAEAISSIAKHPTANNSLWSSQDTSSSSLPRNLQFNGFTDVTVVVECDTYPTELSWEIVDGSSVLHTHEHTGDDTLQVVETVVPNLIINRQYRFIMRDSYGDGIIEGYYAVYYGRSVSESSELLMEQGFSGYTRESLFTVSQPGPAVQPSTPTPAPTSRGTSCINDPEEQGLWMRADQVNRATSHFTNEDSVFGDSQRICREHTEYRTCTNERREDCQWVFTNASLRRGVCRVDPVSKCLENGNCQCSTEDFHGGPSTLGQGILFHAPISVTRRDITDNSNTVTHFEIYSFPTNQNRNHPQDQEFFISKVDFTGRRLIYDFQNGSPVRRTGGTITLSFKLHFLYMDVPIQGRILDGLGFTVDINTDTNRLAVNNRVYVLRAETKKWTCTHVAITPDALYVGGEVYQRTGEGSRPLTNRLTLGQFSGELFDFRIYRGTLNADQVQQVGARCITDPNQEHALQMKKDIAAPFILRGCNPNWYLPGGEGGPLPPNGVQTYGSGPFATLWLRPTRGDNSDQPEGTFDEEYYFQENKLLQYLWEKFLFETGMIAFNQEPYRYWESENNVPIWSETFWNNPCRYMHNLNNAWQHPIWEGALPKWTELEFGNSPDDRFDLSHFYKNRAGEWRGLMFVVHEMFHGTQGSMIPIFDTPTSLWIAESTAEFGSDIAFPASEKILAALTTSPAYPMGLEADRDADRSDHFFTEAVSLHNAVRGGHIYGSWMLWWFLTEHAGIPGIVGEMYSLWSEYIAYRNGEIFLARLLVERHNMDFGDVWGVFAAHLRTWDFPLFGDDYAQSEAEDWNILLNNPDVQPPLPRVTLEQRKSQVELDGSVGTDGVFRAGPEELRPGPNGWNCITARNVPARRYVSIQIQWDDGMGFTNDVQPAWLPDLHQGCDDDVRFFNNMVVVHDEITGERRYWKLKGKRPDTLNFRVGNRPVTIHILMVVTPPADYVIAHYKLNNNGLRRMSPIPMYSYRYSVAISNTYPGPVAPDAEKQYGLVKFEKATPGFWPTRCTCLHDPNDQPTECIRATFDEFEDFTRSPITSITPSPTTIPNQPTRPPSSGGDGFEVCFSGDNTVEVLNHGTVPMRDVRIGDEVLVDDTGRYEPVYSFGHYHKTAESNFVQLHMDDPSIKPLELSRDHMVFLADGRSVAASLVKVGDTLLQAKGIATAQVTKITTVTRSGVYAPFTPSGTIVVNGVVASNYVAFEAGSANYGFAGIKTPLTYHWMAHLFMAPHRVLCQSSSHLCQWSEQYSDEGISLWLYFPTKMLPYFMNQWGILVTPFVLLPLLFLLTVFAILEYLIEAKMLLFVLPAVLVPALRLRANGKKRYSDCVYTCRG